MFETPRFDKPFLFAEPPPTLPHQVALQQIWEGMRIRIAEQEEEALLRLMPEADRLGCGIWRSSKIGDPPLPDLTGAADTSRLFRIEHYLRLGIDDRIPPARIWDLTPIGGIENLGYFAWEGMVEPYDPDARFGPQLGGIYFEVYRDAAISLEVE